VLAAPFVLEAGGYLAELEVAYCTYGPKDAPVMWVSHALTANADVADWWPGLFGPGLLLDPTRFQIICPNILGSCYGTTGPASLNTETGEAYGDSFPHITVKDMARAQTLLMQHLALPSIHLLVGGSLGGMQALEIAIAGQVTVDNLLLLACPARQSAWGQAWNHAQRMALGTPATQAGLAAARAIAMISYRTYEQYTSTQTEQDSAKLHSHAVTQYLAYQGQKLVQRFDANSYNTLALAMDTHDVSRGQSSAHEALAKIEARTLVIALSSDLLFPQSEQGYLAKHIPGAQLAIVHSDYGHDGFLTEAATINGIAQGWLSASPTL
jgi:homoserine O-acetyltransferase